MGRIRSANTIETGAMVGRRGACALGAGALGGLALSLAGCSDASEGEGAATGDESAARTPSTTPEEILADMSLDEKVSQLIIPAVAEAGSNDEHRWNGVDVTDLGAAPQLAEALRRHQYGGVALFASNILETEQTCHLTHALQANNAKAGASFPVPYLICADGEGGVVIRLNMGTRMTGAMAVGATGASAAQNARLSGEILGGELAAVGINVDFAPDADVNVNPANPVIGVRSFGDDPQAVAELACAMGEGIASAGVVPTYKHFPGHGDTETDSHIGTATVPKSLDELRACELVPFAAAVEAGADLVMIAHITCPSIDEAVHFADGSVGYWPATMSRVIVTGILREELGYEGVVVTDSLTMEAVAAGGLVEGEQGTAEYAANVAEAALNAGVDVLLNPRDLVSDEAAAFYDEYVALICKKVEAGRIDQERIDQSVLRVLALKEAHGILGGAEEDLEARIANAQAQVGSSEHHEAEMAMAREAITVVKDDGILPLGTAGNYLLLVRDASESSLADFAVARLREEGLLASDAFVHNLITQEKSGSVDSDARVTIDYYYDLNTSEAHYTEACAVAVAQADVVICETTTWGTVALGADSYQRQTIEQIMSDAHETGAAFVQLSDNLPYDVACYTDADAQVLAYMSSGTGVDPTERASGSDAPAYNANFVAAIDAIFGSFAPTGTLPVQIPVMYTSEEGEAVFTAETLYPRGIGTR